MNYFLSLEMSIFGFLIKICYCLGTLVITLQMVMCIMGVQLPAGLKD